MDDIFGWRLHRISCDCSQRLGKKAILDFGWKSLRSMYRNERLFTSITRRCCIYLVLLDAHIYEDETDEIGRTLEVSNC